jgi:hypothetical protein
VIPNVRRKRRPEITGGQVTSPAWSTRRLTAVLDSVATGPRLFARAAAVSLAGSSLSVIAISLLVRPAGRLPRSQELMIAGALVGICCVIGAGLAAAWWPLERRPSLDRLATRATRSAIWLSLAAWFPLLVVDAYLKARATEPPGVVWLGFGYLDKRWMSALYLLGTLGPMLLLVFSARLLEIARQRPTGWRAWFARSFTSTQTATATPVDITLRDVARVSLKVLSAIAIAYYFFGPPWYVADYIGGVDYHEDVHLGGIQAILRGDLPYIGPAASQYGPGAQLASYLYMKHIGGMSLVGFRESFALFHWLGATIVLLALFLRLRYALALVTALAATLVYPALQLFGFSSGAPYSGFWGWGNVLRYAGAFFLLMLLAPVVRRCPARRGVAAAVGLGLVWGLASYLGQENLLSGALGALAISALLVLSGSVAARPVAVGLGSVAGGFLLIWLPVLAYYAVHGTLGRFVWLYFFIPRQVVSGYTNSSFLEGLHSPWGRMYYTFPFVLALVSLLAVFRFRPLRIADRWSSSRILLVGTTVTTIVLYQGALLRADTAHLMSAMLSIPAFVAVVAVALPHAIGARRVTTLVGLGALVVGLALVLVPREQFQSAVLRGRLEAPYLARRAAARATTAPAPNSLAAERVGPGLASAPVCCTGASVSMPGLIRLMNTIHRFVGDRTAYVTDFKDAYPGLIYFLADLRPAPIPLDPWVMVVTEPQREAFLNEFRARTLKSVEALMTYDLDAPEAQDFIAAYPRYRKVALRYGTEPYYVLLR